MKRLIDITAFYFIDFNITHLFTPHFKLYSVLPATNINFALSHKNTNKQNLVRKT